MSRRPVIRIRSISILLTLCALFFAMGSAKGMAATPGSILAWGSNNYGQCNLPSPNENFLTVAGGQYHSLALKQDGSVLVFGDTGDNKGAIPSPNSGFQAISAGGNHSLAIRQSDGSIAAWGVNANGELLVPAPNAGFTAVSGGLFHSLALRSTGSIAAWGYNGNDQCSVPDPNSGFKAVAAGGYHSLGLKTDGSVVAWGQNTSGQTTVPAPNTLFSAIAAGGSHSLGLKTDGSIVAWGSNTHGQCNLPSPNTGFVAIAAGGSHSVALKSTGEVVAWGYNEDGRCDVPAPNLGYLTIAAGGGHTLAVAEDIGFLQVNLLPAEAIPAGALWRVTTEPRDLWHESGETVTFRVGSHVVEFNTAAGWTTPPNQTVTVQKNQTRVIAATYGALQWQLSTTAVNGSIALLPDQTWYGDGQSVVLTAIPAADYKFSKWTGDVPAGQETSNPLTLLMNSNKSLTAVFVENPPSFYTLSVGKTGTGTGTVDIAPDLTQYIPGSLVTLTASPAANSDFAGWLGDVPAGQETSNPLTLTMDSNKSLTAAFIDKQTQFNLTTLSAPLEGGSISRNPDATSYTYGSLVELTATPAPGYRFVNWSGGVTGTARTVTVVMNSDKIVTANFALIPRYTLQLTRKGEGTLTPTPASADSTYEMGALVTLEAVEAAGWYFAGWFDGVSTDTAPTRSVQMLDNLNIRGTFKPLPSGKKYLTLLVDPTVGGTVTPNPFSADNLYDDNTTVTLTATPAGGYVFEEWLGDASGSTTETQVVMSANRTVTARFVLISQQKHTLTLQKKGDGTVTPDPASADGKYTHGAVVTVTATPGAGSAFVGWLGDVPPLMETTNPLAITLDADKTLIADFDKRSTVTYPLTVLTAGEGGGAVTLNPQGTVFSAGTTVTLTAVPDSDSVFMGWTGDLPTTQALVNPVLITVDSTKTITANFDPDGFCDLVVLAENGTVDVSPTGPTFPRGTTVTLTATPNLGYHFTGWSGDATGTLSPLTINMNTNKTIQANFTLDEYVLNIEAENGTVEIFPLLATYPRGTTVTLTALSDAGYHFTEWSGSIADNDNPIQIVMDSDKTIQANFAGNGYTLTVLAQNGSVDVQPNLPVYAHGTTVTLTATPDTGYHFTGWTGSAPSVLNPLFLTMDSTKTVTANFAPNEYTLTIQAENGSVQAQPNQNTYLHGTTVTLTALPADGYRFEEWSGSTTGTLNPLVLVMDSDKSLTAHFATAAPGNIRATDNESTYKVEVSWDAVTSATHYQVWRAGSLDGERTALSGWIPATAFIDDSVVPGVTYWYWLMAAKSAEGAEASILSDPDPGSAVAETVATDNYKVTYKGLEPTDSGTTGGLKFTATTTKPSLKITALKGKPVGVEKPGVRYLSNVAEIPAIEVTGALSSFSSAAPVELLKVSGTAKSVTASAGLRRLEAGQVGTVKVTALKDATAFPRTFSRLTVQTSDSALPLTPLKMSLKGVVIERLTTQQTVNSLKTATKAYRDKSKVQRVSLAGVGALWLVEPDTLDDQSAARDVDVDGPDLLVAPEIKTLQVKGGSILSEGIFAKLTSKVSASSGSYKSAIGTVLFQGNVRVSLIESPADLKILEARAKKTSSGFQGGYLGYADHPERMVVLVNNIKTKVSGDALVSGIFYAGFDESGKATYTGAIKKIQSKAFLQGEAHISLASQSKMKFLPTQGALFVYTSAPPAP